MSINGLVPSLGGAFRFEKGYGIVIQESDEGSKAILFENIHTVVH